MTSVDAITRPNTAKVRERCWITAPACVAARALIERTAPASSTSAFEHLARMSVLPEIEGGDGRCRGAGCGGGRELLQEVGGEAVDRRRAAQEHVGDQAAEGVLRYGEDEPQVDSRREAEREEAWKPRNQRGNREVIERSDQAERDDRIAPVPYEAAELLVRLHGEPVDV